MTTSAPAPQCDERLLEAFAQIALESGAAIMHYFGRPCQTRQKADRSLASEADDAAEAIVLARLATVAPDVPIVAEEAVSRGAPTAIGREFILVDALDGTAEFLANRRQFTVNLAFVRDGAPIGGVVFAPALERLWLAAGRAFTMRAAPGGALPDIVARTPIAARPRPASGLAALESLSHTDAATGAYLESLGVVSRIQAGSSVKFCLLAEGEADVYARLSATMEWDTAAGHAILAAAGGCVNDLRAAPLRYGKVAQNFKNPGFVAWGAPPALG